MFFGELIRFRSSTQSEKEVSNIPDRLDPYPHSNRGQHLGALVACSFLPQHLWQFLFAKFKVHGIGNVKNIFSIFQYFKMPFLGQDILDWKEKFVESKSVYLQMFKDSGPFEDNTFWLWLAVLKTPFASIHVTFS